MELELNRTQLSGFEVVMDTTIFHEETMEMIVSDAYPDILRIVDTEAHVCLRSKDGQDGRVDLAGLVRATVLYIPDESEGVRKLDVNIPFSCIADGKDITGGCHVVASPRVEGVLTRSLNPRKVLVKVNLDIALQVLAPMGDTLSIEVSPSCSDSVEQMILEEDTYIPVCVQEKPFTFSDNLSISGSRPEMVEFLKGRVNLLCTESKIIGNKLIFKGEVALHILYRGSEQSLCTADYELPFSQIMEISGAGEDANAQITVIATSVEYHPVGGDGRTLGVNLGLLAQGVVRERVRVNVLSDLYSTAQPLRTTFSPYTLHKMLEQGVKSQTERVLMETDVLPNHICDTYVELGTITKAVEGTQLTLTAETQVTVLYFSDGAELLQATQMVPVSCVLELPEGGHCACTCGCDNEVYATPTTGGLEVRLTVDFHYLTQTTDHIQMVSEVQVEESNGEDMVAKPSIVLRMAGRGEKLWDIAKSYGTTVADIRSANDLGEGLVATQVLLIPKKR